MIFYWVLTSRGCFEPLGSLDEVGELPKYVRKLIGDPPSFMSIWKERRDALCACGPGTCLPPRVCVVLPGSGHGLAFSFAMCFGYNACPRGDTGQHPVLCVARDLLKSQGFTKVYSPLIGAWQERRARRQAFSHTLRPFGHSSSMEFEMKPPGNAHSSRHSMENVESNCAWKL